MNNKVTLLNYDYSKWGIVQEGILGGINTSGNIQNYGSLTEQDIVDYLTDLSLSRNQTSRNIIMTTNETGYRQFSEAMRREVNRTIQVNNTI